WTLADTGGFDSCWVFDHFHTLGPDPTGDFFEGWTLRAAWAQAPRRGRIGCLVTGNTYRHPGVLAKMAVTVDHLSGGRLQCGLGAGWAERGAPMFDLEYGTPGQRIARLGEACQIMKSLWTQPLTSFAGKHYAITQAIAEPKP